VFLLGEVIGGPRRRNGCRGGGRHCCCGGYDEEMKMGFWRLIIRVSTTELKTIDVGT
jgi:hypothetical protein